MERKHVGKRSKYAYTVRKEISSIKIRNGMNMSSFWCTA